MALKLSLHVFGCRRVTFERFSFVQLWYSRGKRLQMLTESILYKEKQ